MNQSPRKTIAFFLGTFEDWGGASRALLNFVRGIDRARYRPLVVLTREGTLSAQLDTEGIDWAIWENRDSSKNVLGYAWYVFRAYRFLLKQGIDLIHMNCGATGWKPVEIPAARLAGVPIISHMHITVDKPSPFVRHSSAIIAVSEYIARHSHTFGLPTYAIHNISHLERFACGHDIREELGYGPEHVLTVFMGQMIRQKGIEMLIEAFCKVPNQNARLLLAGGIRATEGAYTEDEVRALVTRDPRIRYLGFRTDAENLYRTADIMVMPSQWEEPCAMILFEAAAAGRPLIATATGGTPEILRNGETGFLIDRTDTQALTQHLQRLIDDPVLRGEMGHRAAQVARDEYAHGPIEKVQHLYDSLL
ncbi:MAG: glycosyltransferase family 4 protein [Pseudomonadota bacterium]